MFQLVSCINGNLPIVFHCDMKSALLTDTFLIRLYLTNSPLALALFSGHAPHCAGRKVCMACKTTRMWPIVMCMRQRFQNVGCL